MVQLEAAATLDPQLFVWAKSLALAPETAMPVKLKTALPELVRVMVWAEVAEPTAWLAKARLVGETLVEGAPPVLARFTPPPPPQDVANKAIAMQAVARIEAVTRLCVSGPLS